MHFHSFIPIVLHISSSITAAVTRAALKAFLAEINRKISGTFSFDESSFKRGSLVVLTQRINPD